MKVITIPTPIKDLTIEERVRSQTENAKIYLDCKDKDDTGKFLNALCESIIHECHFQQRIDIDRACEWLKQNIVVFAETPSMLEDFKKAMYQL